MTSLDWLVLASTLLFITLYGLWKGRGSGTIRGFLLADRSLKWPTVALSIMATQASAITFVSTPGQAYEDGMRFVQFYFGLPLAMVILSITVVPIYHRLKVFTAYEYLELRFDPKMRVLGTLLFLVSRGLAAGMTIYAPSLVLSAMLGLDIRITSLIIGGIVIIYTTTGGVKAVNHTDVFQMLIIMGGMLTAFVIAVRLLPEGISFGDALAVAGASGRLNTVDTSFDPGNRYNLWTGLIGGMFVALAYFGTDQSQVQRYLTGRSMAQSRLGLLFNGLAKVPMQFVILLLGVMVFVFFQFHPSPLLFNPVSADRLRSGPVAAEYGDLDRRHSAALARQEVAVRDFVEARKAGDTTAAGVGRQRMTEAQREVAGIRTQASALAAASDPASDSSDVNYIFLSFVVAHLPAGIVGLVFACIFAASMSSSSGELSALATVSVVDIYRRFIRKEVSDRRLLVVSRLMMACWGIYGILFAQYAGKLGSLVEAVNILGSLFYGTMLGIFLLAFYFKSVGGTAAFVGGVFGEAVVLIFFLFSGVAWLWYNVIGCATVLLVALTISLFTRPRLPQPSGN